MSDPGEIEGRKGESGNPRCEDERDSVGRSNSTKRKRSRKCRSSASGPLSVAPPSLSGSQAHVHEEMREEDEREARNFSPEADGEQAAPPTDQEDHEARFYGDYRKVAEEYDKDFLKKHEEDLNTTLIFSGLFSAVTSAFIIEVNSQLKPDPNDETAALLRILIHKIDPTTFGNEVPILPQWTGPPHPIVQVQAILFASLAVSLFSAFLAMLGKQWLNRYDSSDMRGSVIERCQNRQRKLDGVVAWYFDHVMQSLPLMLQAALLLLGCALSRYLWDVNVTVGSVAIGATSSGVLFYLFIMVAGAASESCPYQTPGSHLLRYVGRKVPRKPYPSASSIRNTFRKSRLIDVIVTNVLCYRPLSPRGHFTLFFRDLTREVPPAFVTDFHGLCRAFTALIVGPYHLTLKAYNRLHVARSTPRQTTTLPLRCISWTLQTSLDKPVHLSTLRHLSTITDVANFDPTLVTDCFNAFVGCIGVNDHKVVVMQGLERLAVVAAKCFFRTFHHLSVADPTSGVLVDLRRRYDRIFPFEADFRGLPFFLTMTKIHTLANERWTPHHVWWPDYQPPDQELTPFARHMVGAARVEYQRMGNRKVPRWILRFALHSLSLDPPPSVVADSLTIIAIDLGCDVSTITSSEESVRVERISSVITEKLKSMVEAADPDPILSNRKPIIAILPFAVSLERDGQQGMFDAILHVIRASNSWGFVWGRIRLYLSGVFGKSSPPSLNRIITLISPHMAWDGGLYGKITITRLAAAASAVPYTEEVGYSVADALLQIVSVDFLRPQIPTEIWLWLKKPLSLPPMCLGQHVGGTPDVIRHVRGLEDPELLKSYFTLVWSEWVSPTPSSLEEMETSIREDFGGIGMRRDREDLAKRLDHVLAQLDRGSEYLKQHNPKIEEHDIQRAIEGYGRLKKVLLEVDG